MKQLESITILWLWHRLWDSRVYQKQASSLARQYSIRCLRGFFARWEKPTTDDAWIENIIFSQPRILVILIAAFSCWRDPTSLYIGHDLDSYTALIILKVLTLWKAKIVFDSHEYYQLYSLSEFNNTQKTFLLFFRRFLFPFTKWWFNGYMTATEDMKEYFPSKIPHQTLYNFPHTAFLDDIEPNNLLDAESTYLVYHGGISKERWIQEICDAYTQIKQTKSIPSCKLLLIGNAKNSATQEIIDNCKSTHGNDMTHTWQLPYNETIAYLKNDVKKIWLCIMHDVWQINRSIPIKMLEYLALDIPQVWSENIASFNEMIAHNHCGETAPIENLDVIVDKVNRINNDYDSYSNAITDNKANYTRQSEEKKLLDFIGKI